MASAKPPGAIRRALRWLFSPSARWSVFTLLVVGLLLDVGRLKRRTP